MTIKVYDELEQGSDEWLQARCGLLTASEVKLIITPKLAVAKNEKTQAHLYELLGQRITRYVEPTYISDDMLRGQMDEIEARQLYDEQIEKTHTVGFITNDKWGFTIGYSPDWLVGEDGAGECKSRRQKYQVQTIIEHVHDGDSTTIPTDYLLQCQTGLAVSERKWIDFVSYHGGLPMVVIRQYPDPVIQDAIINAAGEFEAELAGKLADFRDAFGRDNARMFDTERRIEQEMFV